MVGSMPRMVEDAAVLVDAVVLGVVDPAAIMDAVFEMFVGIVVSAVLGSLEGLLVLFKGGGKP